MKKKSKFGICLGICILLLSGCGQIKKPENPAIVVSKDGRVTSYWMDVFDREYYDIDDLAAMVQAEAVAYNAEHREEGEPVSVKQVELSEDGSGKVRVTLEFNSPETFSRYTGSTLFYGTAAEAAAAGYDLSGQVADVKSNTTADAGEVTGKGQGHVLITDEKVWLYCPGKVTHISSGASVNQDGSIDASAAEEPVIVLMK